MSTPALVQPNTAQVGCVLVNMPEITVKMTMPIAVMQNTLTTDVDWMRNGNSVCRYFTDADAFSHTNDCLTAYSSVGLPANLVLPAVSLAPGASPPAPAFAPAPGDAPPGGPAAVAPTISVSGPVTQAAPAVAERLLRFPATTVSVPEVAGVHAMRLVWCVGGNKPVDAKNLGEYNKALPSGQSQPVIFAELSFAELFNGESGKMVIGTVPMSAGAPLVVTDLFDILHTGVETQAPENLCAHAILEIGVRHTPLSMSSKTAALALHASFHHSSESISTALAAFSTKRQAESHELLQKFTDKTTDDQCNLSLVTLTTGSEACNSKKVDWSQWAASIDAHNALVVGMVVPDLANACIEVGHALATKNGLSGPDGMLQAVRQTDGNVLTGMLHDETNLQVSAGAHYAFDTAVQFDMSAVTSGQRLSTYPTIAATGENQNPGGFHSRCSLLVNQKNLMPLKAALELDLGSTLGVAEKETHVHEPYSKLSRKTRGNMLDLSRLKQMMTSCQGDCEDFATKNMVVFNSVFHLAEQHHAALELGQPSQLQGHLAAYAATHPDLAAYMPAVQHAVLSAAATGRRLNCALVLASGAKLEAGAAKTASVPQTVAGPQGVFAQLEKGMAAGELAGHCVTVEAAVGPLDAANPAHAALAAMQAENKCVGWSLSENTSTKYFEGTGTARQIKDSLSDTVKVNFAAVPDKGLQQKLVELSAKPMPVFQATNLITAIQSQAMCKTGMNANVVQKFSLGDPMGFYRNTLAVSTGAAFSTDGTNIAPTAYIPTANPGLTRMLLHAPCGAQETQLVGMLYKARTAMNATMHELEATAALAGVSNPPMSLRGEFTVQNHAGDMSSVVVKNSCYPPTASRTWQKEHDARAAVALESGMCSFRNINSELWIASFCTNKSPAGAAL